MEISCPTVEPIPSREELSSNKLLIDGYSLSYVEDSLAYCTEDKLLVSLYNHSCENF
jgi:hypothetical protein